MSVHLRQDGVCLVHLHDQMLKATVNVVASLVLPTAGPASRRGLMHRQEAAGRLVDVHDAVCADSVLVHRPAQLDEEPVRVACCCSGLWSSFTHLAGFL